MKVNAISNKIVDDLTTRTLELSQGRSCACFGFINDKGVVVTRSEIVDGGLSGIPVRLLLGTMCRMNNRSLVEGLELLSDNIVYISTNPGKTGLNANISNVDFFNCPVITIGVKNEGTAGVGIVYPLKEYFDLSTKAEKLQISILESTKLKEEQRVLYELNDLSKLFIDITEELKVINIQEDNDSFEVRDKSYKLFERNEVNFIDAKMARELVDYSKLAGQGREVATIGIVRNGRVEKKGEYIKGGMGYVPSRLLASSIVDIEGKSLREVYSSLVPDNAVIVHTHPGGTGVMHIGDANAGPGTWGIPIIAIGHDKEGDIKGSTVIESTSRLYQLAEEDEKLNLDFFDADTQEEETKIRNRKFGIAQEYTMLCKSIELN